MKEVTDKNFGVLIAFWLPGFLLLWGLSFSRPEIAAWLSKSSEPGGPTVGNFLYVTLASLAAGLIVSAFRSLFIDNLFSICGRLGGPLSGLKRPKLDLSSVTKKDTLAAFNAAVDNYYRYYQYYANTFVAVAIAFIAYGLEGQGWLSQLTIVVAVIESTLLLASANSNYRFYQAALEILASKGKENERMAGGT